MVFYSTLYDDCAKWLAFGLGNYDEMLGLVQPHDDLISKCEKSDELVVVGLDTVPVSSTK